MSSRVSVPGQRPTVPRHEVQPSPAMGSIIATAAGQEPAGARARPGQLPMARIIVPRRGAPLRLALCRPLHSPGVARAACGWVGAHLVTHSRVLHLPYRPWSPRARLHGMRGRECPDRTTVALVNITPPRRQRRRNGVRCGPASPASAREAIGRRRTRQSRKPGGAASVGFPHGRLDRLPRNLLSLLRTAKSCGVIETQDFCAESGGCCNSDWRATALWVASLPAELMISGLTLTACVGSSGPVGK